MNCYCKAVRLSRSGSLLLRTLPLPAVVIDVHDDDLDDDDEGNGEEHARRAEDDAEDNGDGVEVEALADECRVDDVVVDLCKRNVEERRLHRELPHRCGGHKCAKGRGDGGAKHGDKLADARQQRKDGGIRQPHQFEIGKDDKPRDDAQDDLTADVGAQCDEQCIKETEDAPPRARV